ncbi:MAG TPA: phosphotransferase [Solirubrobacteraceae bacterium]|nr:phosphotransferase [Solirubrobacteraceae bacterium]
MSGPAPSKGWALRRLGQVIALDVRERWAGHRTPAPGDIPRDIGADWLTAVLCRETRGARVTSVRSIGGSTGTTTRRRLEIAYNDVGTAAALPTRLFVKATATLAQRAMLGLGGFIQGESRFYTQVRPGLDIETPQAYFAADDVRSWRSLVVMEDVARTRQATFWKPEDRVTRPHIEALLAGAATWHGVLWESPRLGRWSWLRTPADHMAVIDALIGLADRTVAGAARADSVIAPALRGRRSDVFAGMRRSMAWASRGPRTYLHGDLHIANTYRTRDGAAGVCDWQIGLQGSWAFDFAYLLATALATEDRRAWEEDLLEQYLERLAAAGGPRISRADGWEAYRRSTLYPYFAWLYTVGRSRVQPFFAPKKMGLVMVQRISAAIDDLGTLAALGL